jgi:hypothetical protein
VPGRQSAFRKSDVVRAVKASRAAGIGRELINELALSCKVHCTPNSDQPFCAAANAAMCQNRTCAYQTHRTVPVPA